MTEKHTIPAMDTTLTPLNAKKRGYKYMADVVYDLSFPSPEIVELVNEYNYRLGQPLIVEPEEGYTGIYAPIAKED